MEWNGEVVGDLGQHIVCLRSLRKLINYLARKRKFLLILGGPNWLWSDKLNIYSGFKGENWNELQARQCEPPGRVLEASATASAITNSSSSAQAAFTGGPSNSKINPQTPSQTEIENLINYLKVWSRTDRERTVISDRTVCVHRVWPCIWWSPCQ